jgi:RHS repeat-associated protein
VLKTAHSANKYLYNSKELQDELLGSVNLDWYDYGARYYDPALGRWHVPDPAAESMSNWSPYNYTFDNPTNLVDQDGTVPGIPPELIATAGIRLKAWANEKLGASFNLLSGSSGSINAPAGMVPRSTQQMSRTLGTISDATSVAQGIVDVGNATATAVGSIPGVETVVDAIGTAANLVQGDLAGAAPYAAGLLLPVVSGAEVNLGKAGIEGTVSALKNPGRAGKQARLRSLVNDPKVGSADRGWIRNEMRHIETGNRSSIRLPGNSRNSTGPGKELAHPRGQRAKDGYSYSGANLQDADLHKLEHKHEGY